MHISLWSHGISGSLRVGEIEENSIFDLTFSLGPVSVAAGVSIDDARRLAHELLRKIRDYESAPAEEIQP